MARIFLTEDEAIEWGLKRKKIINPRKMPEKILVRVLSGLTLLLLGAIVTLPQLIRFLPWSTL